jgi:subtilisin family serine protease
MKLAFINTINLKEVCERIPFWLNGTLSTLSFYRKASMILGVFFLLNFLPVFSVGNDSAQVKRGERPIVDYQNLNDDVFEPGVFKIKFNESIGKHLEKNPVSYSKDGIVCFNIKSIDALNETFGVKSAVQHFYSSVFKDGFTERHRAWGFHLWYRLEVDEKTDIKALIYEYSKIKEFEIVEPVFKKVLVPGSEEFEIRSVDSDILEKGRSWTPNDPYYNYQWAYNNTGQAEGASGADIRMEQAWELQKGNPDVIVAIIDGGIYHPHVDLNGNMWEGIGHNFTTDSPLIDPCSHGTHVAGTVAAVNNNNIGVAGIAGGSGNNDGVRLMSCQVFGVFVYYGFHIAPVYAADNGAAISQNSWGYMSPGYYEQADLDAIDYFNEHGGGDAMEGGITIFAAGNTGGGHQMYPAYYSGAVSVAASNTYDIKPFYSTYGDWIDISAPGGDMEFFGQILSTNIYDSYGMSLGTSMAAPHVSGVAALIISHKFGMLTNQQVVDILLNSTDYHYHLNQKYIGQLGTGRLNAYNALTLAENYLDMPQAPNNFNAYSNGLSEITLIWSPAGGNSDVIIAWSPDGRFGNPQSGQSYEAGSFIDGGGEILFAGSGFGFNHEDLISGTLYHYKIWSLNNENVYSVGRSASAYTDCDILELPYVEEFRIVKIPQCWTEPDDEHNWFVHESYGNPGQGLVFYLAPRVYNYSQALETPLMNGFIAGSSIDLELDLLLHTISGMPAPNEKMAIEIFDGFEWHQLTLFDGSGGDFMEISYNIDITDYALNNIFKIRFVARGNDSFHIHSWVIDNIVVYSSSCLRPVNISAENISAYSAEVVWEIDSEDVMFDIIYGLAGFSPEHEGDVISGIDSKNYDLTGLEPYTKYSLYVRTDCGEGDISLWSRAYEFQTLATCPAPENLMVNEITMNTALVSWSPFGVEDIWQIKYGNPGFNPAFNGYLVDNITTTEYMLEGLEGMSSYDLFVRAYCEADDQSFWVGPVNFRTECDCFAIPYSESFSSIYNECWKYPEGKGNWGIGELLSPPSSLSGAPNAYFIWNPVQDDYEFSLLSPKFDATDITEDVLLGFFLYLNNYNNNSIENMRVEYRIIGHDEWTVIGEYSNENAGNSKIERAVFNIMLDDVQGSLFQIRFVAHGESTFNINGWGIDDVQLYFTPKYAVNITAEGLGQTTPKGNIILDPDGSISVDANAYFGSHIKDVLLDGVSIVDEVNIDPGDVPVNASFTMNNVNSHHNIHVIFEKNLFELTLVVEPEGTGVASGAGMYAYNDLVIIEAEAASGYEFSGWSDESGIISELALHYFRITGHKTIVANFELKTNINEGDAISNIMVYPNPANQRVWVEFNAKSSDNVKVELYSMYGQKVAEQTADNAGYVKLYFDLVGLTPGIYFIRFSQDGQSRKIIVN